MLDALLLLLALPLTSHDLSQSTADSTATASVSDLAVEFSSDLDRISKRGDDGKWASVEQDLLRLLERHGSAQYVLRELARIEVELRRACFWSTNELPDGRELFHAEKVRLTPNTGRVELEWSGDQGRHDFLPNGIDDPDFERERLSKYSFEKVRWELPVKFDGTYSIEIEAPHLPEVWVAVQNPTRYTIQLLFGTLHAKGVRREGTEYKLFSESKEHKFPKEKPPKKVKRGELKPAPKPSPLRKLKIVVSSTSVRVSIGSRSIMTLSKQKDIYGGTSIVDLTSTRYAPIFGPDSRAKIRVEGRAKAWIDSQIDQRMQKAWQEFDAQWEFYTRLPEPLASAARELTATDTRESQTIYPGPISVERSQKFHAVEELLKQKEWSAASALIEALTEEPLLQSWCYARLYKTRGDWLQLGAKLGSIMSAAPGWMPAHHEHLEFLLEGGKFDSLQSAATKLHGLAPTDGLCFRYQALGLIRSGQMDRVPDLLQEARARGVGSSWLFEVESTLLHMERGPEWNEREDYSTRHYQVSTDLSLDVAKKIARELEQSFRHYQQSLGHGEHMEDALFPVWVFSGEAGYLEYIERLLDASTPHTLGVYLPTMETILLWNSSDPGQTMDTVRHEAFHQFFHRFANNPPIWLDEGLANYFAFSRTGTGWRNGGASKDHVALLVILEGRRDLPKLRGFLSQSRREFMSNAVINYTVAWGFVHFLQHSTRENKERVKLIIEAVVRGDSHADLLKEAFKGVRWLHFDREFAAYVRGLGGKR
ncbi:MAG: hypothetical protein ACI835_003183 [Planctomycetota bacterium]|jgi:hypothetical protein